MSTPIPIIEKRDKYKYILVDKKFIYESGNLLMGKKKDFFGKLYKLHCIIWKKLKQFITIFRNSKTLMQHIRPYRKIKLLKSFI